MFVGKQYTWYITKQGVLKQENAYLVYTIVGVPFVSRNVIHFITRAWDCWANCTVAMLLYFQIVFCPKKGQERCMYSRYTLF